MNQSLRSVQARRLLLKLYQRALKAVDGADRVHQFLRAEDFAGQVELVAVGKAAAAMAKGARQALGPRLRRGLVITKQGHCGEALGAGWECLESDHPLPGDASLRAGQRLLEFLRGLSIDRELLVLVSGGASSLVEVLPEGVDTAQLQHLNRWLLGSGLAIGEVNRIRKRLSAIKAGRLIHYLRGRPVRQLLLSDVPGNDPAVIGSGLLIAHTETELELHRELLPNWLQALVQQAPALPSPADFRKVRSHLVGSSAMAVDAAAAAACESGWTVTGEIGLLVGDALEAGRAVAARLSAMAPGILVQGAETTVRLPDRPGRGGRCQSLALAAAQVLEARDDCYLLAAGTDGTDGPGEDAGALVDGGTLHRGDLSGLDAAGCLLRADAGTFLEASGDLVYTGPTGTNVMDLVIGIKTA